MTVPLGYHDLLEMLPKPGCAICNLLRRDAERFLDALIYEFVTDPPTHKKFRASRGLCNQHSAGLTAIRGAALGVAILQGAALDEVMTVLASVPEDALARSPFARLMGAQGTAAGEALAEQLGPQAPCPACVQLAESQRHFVDTFGGHFHDPHLQTAYAASDGFCLPHVRQVLRAFKRPHDLRQFIAIQRQIWEKLAHELAEFQRKSDAHYGDEVIGAEGTSWQRAVTLLAGAPGALPNPTRLR